MSWKMLTINPETSVMSDDITSNELEKPGDPKIVVMSDNASTSDRAGDNMKITDNPEKILMSDGAGCDVVTQSQAKITSVDDSSSDLPNNDNLQTLDQPLLPQVSKHQQLLNEEVGPEDMN
jgi:hypothetical protein